MNVLAGLNAATLITPLLFFYTWFFDDTPWWFYLFMAAMIGFISISCFKFMLDREIKAGKRPALPPRPWVRVNFLIGASCGVVFVFYLIYQLEWLKIAALVASTLAIIYVWWLVMLKKY